MGYPTNVLAIRAAKGLWEITVALFVGLLGFIKLLMVGASCFFQSVLSICLLSYIGLPISLSGNQDIDTFLEFKRAIPGIT